MISSKLNPNLSPTPPNPKVDVTKPMQESWTALLIAIHGDFRHSNQMPSLHIYYIYSTLLDLSPLFALDLLDQLQARL